MKNIEAFIIHLSRAIERKSQVEALIDALSFKTEIIPACDGREIVSSTLRHSYSERLHKPHYPFKLNNNEIACFLSHRKAWQAIVDRGLDAALIFEDDIGVTDQFNHALKVAITHCRPGTMIRFPVRADREHGDVLFHDDDVKLIRPRVVGLRMMAQLISNKAAVKLLAATERFDRPVDTFLQMRWITHIDILSVVPAGIIERSKELGGSTIQRKKTIPQKIMHELLRPIYRAQVSHYSSKTW